MNASGISPAANPESAPRRAMSRMVVACTSALLAATVVATAALTAPLADAAVPPSYQLQYLGPGTPVGISNGGVVIGTRIVGNAYQPLVSVGGAPWSGLPVLRGAVSVFPTDVNDGGVIVGVSFNAQFNAVAVRWKPTPAGYVVEELPRLPGDPSSYATGINNMGEIVGARRALGYVPAATSGWLYSDALGVVDLSTFGFWIVPAAINDAGTIIGGIERLNLDTGIVDVIGNGPANYNAVTGVAINASGMVAGAASLRSSSLNIVSVFRYEGAAGWRFIAGSSKYTVASSINNLGDVGYGEQGAGRYLEGLGTYAVSGLLRPDVVAAGWAITGSGVHVNDARMIATAGRNGITGETGGVVLTPAGTLPPPSAPTGLQGVAHTASAAEPYNAIVLNWTNTSTATTGYELERQQVGAATWARLSLVPPGVATGHTDTTVGVGILYDYRVRAVGLGGASDWSNVARVQSPTTPLDTTPPSVRVIAPADGATVSGIVAVAADATDNVAVAYLEISYWNPYLGREVVLGSAANAGALTANWDTRALTPAAYRLRAFANDAMGNWKQADVTVTVAGNATATFKVSDIALVARVKGNMASVSGDVQVTDAAGRGVPGASVAATWTSPGGGSQSAAAQSGSDGRARFEVMGPRGTYTLKVSGVAKAGYAFDAAKSILERSIVTK